MKRLFPIFLTAALLLSGCGIIAETPEPTPTPEPVPQFVFTEETFPRIEGSASLEPLAEAVASVMLGAPREEAAEFLEMGNTAQSYTDLVNGDCGFVLAAELSDTLALQVASDCETAPVARDALVFYVSEANPVDSLTMDQLAKIYTGEYTNWSQVGGDDVAIKAFARYWWSGCQAAVEDLVGDVSALQTETVGTGFDGSAGAIGYAAYQYAAVMEMTGDCKLLTVDDVEPNNDTIASGGYPLILNYSAAISADAAEGSPERILWEWLQGPDGQKFIASQGYVPAR